MTDARDTVEIVFRGHAGQMVSTLTRIFGAARIDLVEDAVHEALVRALRLWPHQGEPANPTAWLIQVAKNAALDRLRREGRERELPLDLVAGRNPAETSQFASELRDDRLCMVFACCDPALSPEAQVALTLKTACGFSTREIARAFLVSEHVMAQRLVRAKAHLRQQDVRPSTPPPEALRNRLPSVLGSLYLLFNEGYSAMEGEDLVRFDLCREALMLADLVATHPVTECPRAHALAALICFQAARLPTRIDAAGELLLLSEQDRSEWDGAATHKGLRHMERSAAGDERTDYHLEAEIAACHTLAPSFEATDWPWLAQLYGQLLQRKPSPVVELNRIVALSYVEGPDAALSSLERLGDKLDGYYPFHATRGEMLRRSGRLREARAAVDKAIECTQCEPVRRFLRRCCQTP